MIRIFGHYIPRGLLFLLAIEFIAFVLCVHLATEIRLQEVVSSELYHSFHLKSMVFAGVYLLVMVAVGLYQRGARDNFLSTWSRLFWATIITFWVLSLIFYVLPDLEIGRGVFAISLLIGFGFLSVERYLFSLLSNREFFRSRLMVIGAGPRAKQLLGLRRKSDWRGITLVGFVKLGDEPCEIDPERVISGKDSIIALVQKFGVDEIVVALEDGDSYCPIDELIQLKLAGLKITEISSFFEYRTGRMQLDILSPQQVLFFEGFQTNYFSEMIKRLFDVVTSSLFLLISVPIILVLYFLIKRESKWREPVIYSQIRVGQRGKPFTIYKFRSMVVDAEKDGPQYASQNDARVTAIGAFIRRTRLDEIPQMWNVLKGDMSFVGPRPERPEFVSQLSASIPYYNMRHRVKPGITGWAQICYPYGDNEEDAKQKLQYDLYYIKNFSLFLDLTILIQTAQVIIWQKGAR